MTSEKRSVIKVGRMSQPEGCVMVERPRSYQMTLPKWWCRKHGFPTSVHVSECDDGALLVKVAKEE